MLVDFFLHLKAKRLPVSTQEYLNLLAGLQANIAEMSLDQFYYLARLCLIKDEANYDKFDRAFGEFFKGIEALPGLSGDIPEDWLRSAVQQYLSMADQQQLQKLGWDQLMATFRQRLAEQKERHAGGSKWIGTNGRSPFGNDGNHPEGIRIGGNSKRNSAVKVWEQRHYRNLDETLELGVRNIQIALRRLRRFARQGAANELDLPATISSTAENAGWLSLQLRPQRHNTVNLLIFFDVGGSMASHVQVCSQLFTAVKSEFKHLVYYYFHNCIYEYVWQDNQRRLHDRHALNDIIHRYGNDYKVVIVGDASMSPYEITHPGGAIDFNNEESGAVWLQRVLDAWPNVVWLNPIPPTQWAYYESIGLIRQQFADRMFPLTLEGLSSAMKQLSQRR